MSMIHITAKGVGFKAAPFIIPQKTIYIVYLYISINIYDRQFIILKHINDNISITNHEAETP